MKSSRRTLFDLAGGGDAVDWKKNLFWLRLFMLMHVASRTVMALHGSAAGQETWLTVTWYLLIATCLLGFIPRCNRAAICGAAGLLGIQIVGTMPITANHVFLEFLCLATLALLHQGKEQERELAIKVLRWLVVIMLFYGGLQKLVYGYYFDGQFLAYATAVEERFGWFFGMLIPAEEFVRLQGLDPTQLGAGPYRVDSTLFVAISNFTYLFEMGAPILLIWPKTRRLAAMAAILFVIGIELGAREILFGALVINLLLLYFSGPWIKRLFPFFGCVYLYLVMAEFELVPMFRYYQ